MKSDYTTYQDPVWEKHREEYEARYAHPVIHAACFKDAEDRQVFDTEKLEFAYTKFASERRKRAELGTQHHWLASWAYRTAGFMWRYRRLHHFFMAPGAAAHCSSLEPLPLDYSSPNVYGLPACLPVRHPPQTYYHWFTGGDSRCIPGGFVLHFPIEEGQRSILVVPSASRRVFEDPQGPQAHLYHNQNWQFMACDGRSWTAWRRGISVGDGRTQELDRLVLGFGAYYAANQENFTEAEIHDTKFELGPYRGDHTAVKTGSLRTVIPHTVPNYQRKYRHWRYTNMRGQVGWVNGYCVKVASAQDDVQIVA